MAMVTNAFWWVAASFKDRDDNYSSLSFKLPAALSDTEAVTAALVVINAADALSDAVLTGYTISRGSVDHVAIATGAPETSDVERKGVFVWRADNGQTVKIEVPSILNTLVVDGTNVIAPTDAAVLAFVNGVINTGIGAGNSPITNAGASLVALTEPGKKVHRKSSKG